MISQKKFLVVTAVPQVFTDLLELLQSDEERFWGRVHTQGAVCRGFESFGFGIESLGAFICRDVGACPQGTLFCAEVDQPTFEAFAKRCSRDGIDYPGGAKLTVRAPNPYEAWIRVWNLRK
jgi:hypothetical protein